MEVYNGLYPSLEDKSLERLRQTYRQQIKYDKETEISPLKGKRHFGKRRKYLLPAFSAFPPCLQSRLDQRH